MRIRPFSALSVLRLPSALLPALLAALACSPPLPLFAQSITFAGAQSTLSTTGLSGPSGLAVDSAGDLFIANTDKGYVVELPRTATGFGPQTTLPTSGINNPNGIAVDSAGDVFIADTGNSRVLELPLTTNGFGSQVVLPTTGLVEPDGVAVDSAGDVYITDAYNGTVVELPRAGTGYGTQTTLASSSQYSPTGIALDSAGDLFFAYENYTSQNLGNIVELPKTASGFGTPVTLAAGSLAFANGLAVDSAGNLFIPEDGHTVLELPRTSTGYGPLQPVGSGWAVPQAVAVDSAGDVFVADRINSDIVEVQPHSVNFGTANVCAPGQTTPAPCSQSMSLTYTVVTATDFSNSPAVLSTNDSFTTSTTLGAGEIPAGHQFTVNVNFAPTGPGPFSGQIALFDGSGNPLIETPVYGQGEGPAVAFGPAAQVKVAVGGSKSQPQSNGSQPSAVAVGGYKELFIADEASGTVSIVGQPGKQSPGSGAGYGRIITLADSLNTPTALAADGAGDVFIADTGDNRIIEANAFTNTTTALPFVGLAYPYGVAVDSAGNVFASDFGNNRVVELPINGAPQITIGSGFSEPAGLAVDAAGDLFVADLGNNRVEEITPAGVQTTIPATGLSVPTGVAVDPAGDVYISDSGNNRILEVHPNGAQNTLGTGIVSPLGLALDFGGNLYVVNEASDGEASGEVLELVRSQPPALSFAAANVGSTSTDSPQLVTVENIGNDPLLLHPGVAIDDEDFLHVAQDGSPRDCGPPFFLQPGVSCALAISFDPLSAGNLSGTATLTDNALNVDGATQAIPLSGIGVGPTAQVSATTLQFGSIAPGSAETLSLTITNVGGDTLTIAPSINGPSYKILPTSTCAAGVAAAASCTLQIQFSPLGIGLHNDALTLQTNGPANPIVYLDGIGSGIGVSSTLLQFGSINYVSTEVLPLTISNYGVQGTITIGTVINGPSYQILTTAQNTCLAGIAFGHSCTLPVQFAPVGVGLHNDVLTLTPGAGAPAFTINLDGVGTKLRGGPGES